MEPMTLAEALELMQETAETLPGQFRAMASLVYWGGDGESGHGIWGCEIEGDIISATGSGTVGFRANTPQEAIQGACTDVWHRIPYGPPQPPVPVSSLRPPTGEG